MDVGTRLKAARDDAGLSLGQASQLTSIPRDVIRSAEEGLEAPSSSTIKALGKIYGVSDTWLATGTLAPLATELEAELARWKNQSTADSVRRILGQVNPHPTVQTALADALSLQREIPH